MKWHLELPLERQKQTPFEFFATIGNAFTPQECNDIIRVAYGFKKEDAKITDTTTEKFENTYRNGAVRWLDSDHPDTHWIYRKLTDYVKLVNEKYYKWDLDYIENLQFTTYDDLADKYDKHFDHIWDTGGYRKLSFSLQLTDASLYSGADLELYHDNVNKTIAERALGSMTFFPSFMLHKVTPLTRGKRYSLVGWVNGPPFR